MLRKVGSYNFFFVPSTDSGYFDSLPGVFGLTGHECIFIIFWECLFLTLSE